MKIDYNLMPGTLVSNDILDKCSELYSNHYGFWSKTSPHHPSLRVKLSAGRIQEWLSKDNASIYYAEDDKKLIGYAIAIQLKVKNYGEISWVTQLVVHEEYRQQGIAKTLLYSIWGLSNHFAWGILSANPYAIRALEKATRRRCIPQRIKKNKKKLLNVAKEYLPFINENTYLEVTDFKSLINTNFHIDHSQTNEMIRLATKVGTPWLLGDIEDGYEWFAFTFHDQNQLELSADEIEDMINSSEKVTQLAYSRMLLDNDHQWLKHTDDEVSFIIEQCGLSKNNSILDIGCGMGRHSISLAEKGHTVIGVDNVQDLIEKGTQQANAKSLNNVSFIEDDCRAVNLDKEFDLVICLYDVIGSYVTDMDNQGILKSIEQHLKYGGFALISVMNYEFTQNIAKHTFSFSEEPNRLLQLNAATIMEKTGDIFNPDYFLLDKKTHVVYRKEQFSKGEDQIPTELIVRDRRFTKVEIETMCMKAGLKVEWSRYVGAGRWSDDLEDHDSRAKEILVLCSKN